MTNYRPRVYNVVRKEKINRSRSKSLDSDSCKIQNSFHHRRFCYEMLWRPNHWRLLCFFLRNPTARAFREQRRKKKAFGALFRLEEKAPPIHSPSDASLHASLESREKSRYPSFPPFASFLQGMLPLPCAYSLPDLFRFRHGAHPFGVSDSLRTPRDIVIQSQIVLFIHFELIWKISPKILLKRKTRRSRRVFRLLILVQYIRK